MDKFDSITPDDWRRSMIRSKALRNPLVDQIRSEINRQAEVSIPDALSRKIELSAALVNNLRDTLLSIIDLYVSSAKNVQCQTYTPGDGPDIVFVLSMCESDFRKAVGKKGRNYKALECVMSEIGETAGVNINVKIKAPTGDPDHFDFVGYDPGEVIHVVKAVVSAMTGMDHHIKYTWIDVNACHLTCTLKLPISKEAEESIIHILSMCGSKFKRKIYLSFS
jgi:predicted RNA-binding protein YlqC (UPF0109 family)